MLARILQISTIAVTAIAVFWLCTLWAISHWLALAAFIAILGLPVAFLGFQFAVLKHFNRHDPAPAASGRQLLGAWWGEIGQVWRTFYWRQPFAWSKIQDTDPGMSGVDGRRGIVFIHGFICNRGLWTPWLKDLSGRGNSFAAVNLEPIFGSIEAYVPIIEEAISRVSKVSGTTPLIVCHSMGGLAIRAWLRSRPGNDARLHHVVTIGTPHHGTWLGRMAFSKNGKQMRLNSRWLLQLEAEEPPSDHKLFTCFYSNCDNIVFPASTATLAGADNRLVIGAAHVALAFDPVVMSETLAMLEPAV